MAIHSDMIRGLLETMMLSLIEEKDYYGFELSLAIKKRSEGLFEIKEASLYATLQRLHEKGMIDSYLGEKTHGKKRRYYHLTPTGKTYLKGKKQEWDELKQVMSRLMEKPNGSDS